MIEPRLALRAAVRNALVNDPAVTALVQPDRIRSGSTRPENMPVIILAGEHTLFLGRAAGGQLLARVYMDTHIWGPDNGADLAFTIGGAVAGALFNAPGSDIITIDDYARPLIRWMRDPAPERTLTHGVVEIEAVVRWAA